MGSVMIRGNGITYKLYLNGELVAEQPEMIDRGVEVASWSKTLQAGENVIAIEATCLDSIHFAWFKAGVLWGPRTDSKVQSDTTWKYSWENPSGWNAAGFDDGSWHYVDSIGAYDPKSDALNVPQCEFIWPGVMSFRKVFDVGPTIGVAPVAQVRAASRRSRPGQWYSLTGRRISKSQAGTGATGVVIEAVPGSRAAARLRVGAATY